MFRIKEVIQRRRLIQQLNDDWMNIQLELEPKISQHMKFSGSTFQAEEDIYGYCGGGPRGSAVDGTRTDDNHHAYLNLIQFVDQINSRLTDAHRRALRVTWNRLSEPPKTSGRGILKIMERVFEVLVEKCPSVMPIFYRSAFMGCLRDAKNANKKKGSHQNQQTIVTLRDHAHLLIELLDGIICIMFDIPIQRPLWDPVAIGLAHVRLAPLGFDKRIWHLLGEVFAEVMFCQECVRAYPLAASAWSVVIVAIADKIFRSSTKIKRDAKRTLPHQISLQISPFEDDLSLQFSQIVTMRGDFRHYGFFPATQNNLRANASRLVRERKRQMERRKQRMSITSANKQLRKPRELFKWWQQISLSRTFSSKTSSTLTRQSFYRKRASIRSRKTGIAGIKAGTRTDTSGTGDTQNTLNTPSAESRKVFDWGRKNSTRLLDRIGSARIRRVQQEQQQQSSSMESGSKGKQKAIEASCTTLQRGTPSGMSVRSSQLARNQSGKSNSNKSAESSSGSLSLKNRRPGSIRFSRLPSETPAATAAIRSRPPKIQKQNNVTLESVGEDQPLQ